MKKARNKVDAIMKVALARSQLTTQEMCMRAGISYSTYQNKILRNTFTRQDLRRIRRVVHLSDEELIEIVRG